MLIIDIKRRNVSKKEPEGGGSIFSGITSRRIFGVALASFIFYLLSLPLIFAFEAHVLNVTAKINGCSEFEIRSRGYWKNHEENWTLPQTVGAISVSTPEDAEDMLNGNEDMTDRLERELLALKFNVAHFGVGNALVPGENITINELIAEADELLIADFPDPDPVTDQELEDMKDRVEKVNNTEKVSSCKNPPPPKDDCDKDKDDCDCKLRVTRIEGGGTRMIMTRGNSGDDCDDSEGENGEEDE